jgi:toxin-antitoxin system PIN domain toxin
LILPDVNVLLYAFRPDTAQHEVCKSWLDSVTSGVEPFCVSPQVLSSLIRITTNPRVYSRPDPPGDVIAFAHRLLDQSHCRVVHPGPQHWSIFCDLCRITNATGNLVPDAWFAALAIEHGCEWITDDRDYARFPGLRWRSIRQLNA